MDDAVRARAAARETVADIEPPALREVLFDRLEAASMAPGVLVVASATGRDPSTATEPLLDRSAGVQLIYEGLRLTRSLAHSEPWATVGDREIDADMDILAADVLVSRGFYLLARTEASTAAVETIRAFGRDQTDRRAAPTDDDRAALDRNLEADIFALAVRAGVTAVGGEPSEALLNHVAAAAREYDGDTALPPAGAVLTDPLRQRLSEHSTGGDGPVASSVGDP
ncbi:hypothetical protein EGH24_00100 [Halonotius terrestris]|uniref:Uncharacterized protein n=1 Tax=Halonotius terrestris TaxID=2487750 RepID=A0A8J8TCF0_9EURY|nr:hypothetical protein [Halonotius terrestris]TQQ83245.1 hypothetical protein EGH24_00100 [Halonotius terrestris]